MRRNTIVRATTLLGLLTATLSPVGVAAATTDPSTGPTSSTAPTEPPEPGPELFITADGSPQAGEEIGVVIRCAGDYGDVASPVLEIGEFAEVDTPSGIPTYEAPATIDADTEPGDYPLTGTCEGEELGWTFHVYPSAGDDDGQNGDDQGEDGSEDQQVDRIPRGAAETGGQPPSDHSGVLWATGLSGLALAVVTTRRAVRR